MATESATKPLVKPWILTPDQRTKISRLNATSQWLRNPSDPEALKRRAGKWVAAKDCQIIAAADTLDELYGLLKNEESGTYMIACLRGSRITCEPR